MLFPCSRADDGEAAFVGNFTAVKVGSELDALEELKIASVFPIDQSYFVIFDASAASIGGIPDADLRSKIIQFYVSAKSMVDSLRDYGRLVRDLSQPSTTPTSVPASIQRVGREIHWEMFELDIPTG
jgi:hypothetical protein